MSKKLSKQKLNDIITYGIVIAAFVIMQILINAGEISSLFQGLMVPLCTYIILAISLNLVGRYSRRIKPWSCRFYVCRCIYKFILFKSYAGHYYKFDCEISSCTSHWNNHGSNLWNHHWYSGIAIKR